MTCTCDDRRKPACAECERRARCQRCWLYLRAKYRITDDRLFVVEGERVRATLADGRTVTARVDIDRDRVVEEVTSGR